MAQKVDFSHWKQLEEGIASKRIAKCNETLNKLLGPTNGKAPRIGLAFSGGGWRAMMSGVAVLDALATPLDASETYANEEGVKLLDTISHAFGLSGGSWALYVALAGGYRNAFHHDPLDKSPIGPEDRQRHPWIHGQQNKFDPDVHQYAGLRFMTDSAHVSQACYRGGATTRLVSLSAGIADTTFGSSLATKLLGTTLIERWANFLANDILSFKDNGELKMPTKEVQEESNKPSSDASAAEIEAVKQGSATATAAVQSAVKAAEKVAAKDPNIGSKARDVKLSSLRTLIENGDFPFVVNTAIADKQKLPSDVKYSNSTRLYDWIEISPYFVRNSVTGNYTHDVDSCGGYFVTKEVPDRARNDLRLHHYMAVCGSAFACDAGALLPKGVSDTVRNNIKLHSSPILGGGLTDIIYGTAANAPICTCRDAGIDFNVPFPPLLNESAREFDIIIAMDAGADSNNAYELERACELGYLKLQPDCKPKEIFPEGVHTRVYRSLNGGPTVIYFLGLTKRATSKVIYKSEQLLHDVAKVRHNVLEDLIPILLSELRLLNADKMASAGGVMKPSPSLSSLNNRVKYNSASSRANFDLAADDDDADGSNVKTPATPYGSAQPQNGKSASQSGFNQLAENIIVNAATHGQLVDSVDSFFAVEFAVMGSIQPQRRASTIVVLEEEAIANLTNTHLPTPLMDRVGANGSNMVELLAEIGILLRVNWNDVLHRKLELAPEWIDFYATTSLVRHLIPQAVEATFADKIYRVIQRDGIKLTSTPQHIDHVFVSGAFRATTRLCLLLGSMVAKLAKYKCDVSATASSVITRRYLAQLQLSYNTALGITCQVPVVRRKMYDDLEASITRICQHLVDFFAEMLSFEHLNQEMVLSSWDKIVLQAFATTVRDILEGITDAHHSGKISPATHGILLAEVIARHPSERTFTLLRILCEDKTTSKSLSTFQHLGSPRTLDPTSTKGIVRLVAGNPTLQRFPEDLLRIVEAAYDSADGYKSKRDAIQQLMIVAAGPNLQMTYPLAVANCFPASVKRLIGTGHLDDSKAVTAMVQCNTHYATFNRNVNKRAAMFVLWTDGAASQEFRVRFAAECYAAVILFDFLSPFIPTVRILRTATSDQIDQYLDFAEKCKNSVKKLEAENVTAFNAEQKSRFDRFNRPEAFNKAVEVTGAVAGKLSAAIGKTVLMKSLFSKK